MQYQTSFTPVQYQHKADTQTYLSDHVIFTDHFYSMNKSDAILLWLYRVPQMSREVPAHGGFLCGKAVVFGAAIKETLSKNRQLFFVGNIITPDRVAMATRKISCVDSDIPNKYPRSSRSPVP